MTNQPDLAITPAAPTDAEAISHFCQPIYAAIYPNTKYGLKPEHFAPEVFRTPDIIAYFAKTFTNTNHQRAYLAKHQGNIGGCISIERLARFYEIRALYVDLDHHQEGIGKRLLLKALEFYAGDLPLRVEVAETNLQTIAIYKHWGFTPAPQYGVNLRHWPEWPDGLQNGYIFMQAQAKDIHVKA
jgi:GNAT superfamily N-acetyltransferase